MVRGTHTFGYKVHLCICRSVKRSFWVILSSIWSGFVMLPNTYKKWNNITKPVQKWEGQKQTENLISQWALMVSHHKNTLNMSDQRTALEHFTLIVIFTHSCKSVYIYHSVRALIGLSINDIRLTAILWYLPAKLNIPTALLFRSTPYWSHLFETNPYWSHLIVSFVWTTLTGVCCSRLSLTRFSWSRLLLAGLTCSGLPITSLSSGLSFVYCVLRLLPSAQF